MRRRLGGGEMGAAGRCGGEERRMRCRRGAGERSDVGGCSGEEGMSVKNESNDWKNMFIVNLTRSNFWIQTPLELELV
jgi:hypothetical protein